MQLHRLLLVSVTIVRLVRSDPHDVVAGIGEVMHVHSWKFQLFWRVKEPPQGTIL